MKRYTTPTLTFVWTDIDLTDCEVYVTIAQRGIMTFSGEDVTIGEDNEISITLTQEQTAQLKVGTAKLQCNAMYPDGSRKASDVIVLDVTENLLTHELEHQEEIAVARTAAESAKEYARQAALSMEEAQGYAESAKESAESADDYEDDAKTAAEAAESYINNVILIDENGKFYHLETEEQ